MKCETMYSVGEKPTKKRVGPTKKALKPVDMLFWAVGGNDHVLARSQQMQMQTTK